LFFCYACFAFGEAKQAFVASQEAKQASLASHGGKTSKAGMQRIALFFSFASRRLAQQRSKTPKAIKATGVARYEAKKATLTAGLLF
jgi:hypothetical protein